MTDSKVISGKRNKAALLIGNDNYQQPANKLKDSISNAIKLKRLLEKANFKVMLEKDLVEKELKAKLKEFSETATQEDNSLILFYYSGHACHVNGKNYLIPIDDDKIEKFGDVDDFSADLDGRIKKFMTDNSSDATVFILDCPTPYTPKKVSASASKNDGIGLTEITPPNGAFIQFACDAKKTVEDASGIDGYGLFTKHLLKHITEKDTSIVNVFQHISDAVYKDSKGKQRPLSMNGLSNERPIYLIDDFGLVPQIPYDATWQKKGSSVTGGRGFRSTSDRLNTPRGLHIKKNDVLMIADTNNNRILNYRPSTGKTRALIETAKSGYSSEQFCRPADVIFDDCSKDFVISDTGNCRILRWRPKTTENTRSRAGVSGCFGMTMDNEGALYVCNADRNEVRRYEPGDTRGTLVAGGNGQGSRLHQLNHPTYVAVGLDQSVYVSDSNNNRVVKWIKGAKKGIILAGGHGKGKDRIQLDYPTGIVVDQSDTIYVADYWNHRIMRWYKDALQGEIILGDRFHGGNDVKHLNGPEGLAFDRDGNLYVADSNNHRIQKFNIDQN